MEYDKFMQYGRGLGLWQNPRKSIEPDPIKYFRDDPVYLTPPKEQYFSSAPIINMERERVDSIIKNEPAIFEIAENVNAKSGKPLIELDFFDEVDANEGIIDAAATEMDLNPSLLKAVVYMESTHGYYDRLHPQNRTFRPMNISYETWGGIAQELGYTKDQIINDPVANIRTGAVILKRISARVPNPTIRKVASIYNFTGAESVTDYGARVDAISKQVLWKMR